jgi:hypothetical protein
MMPREETIGGLLCGLSAGRMDRLGHGLFSLHASPDRSKILSCPDVLSHPCCLSPHQTPSRRRYTAIVELPQRLHLAIITNLAPDCPSPSLPVLTMISRTSHGDTASY